MRPSSVKENMLSGDRIELGNFYHGNLETAKRIGSRKRGISWHITVAIRREDDQNLQMMMFVYVFRSCYQDSCAVLSIMSDVLRQLKEAQPQMKNIYYLQDNAGCYHCGTTIVGAGPVSQQHEVSVKRMDFCDSQAGKWTCDRKAATVKSHMKTFLTSGNNIERKRK